MPTTGSFSVITFQKNNLVPLFQAAFDSHLLKEMSAPILIYSSGLSSLAHTAFQTEQQGVGAIRAKLGEI